jgi:hypothetical protein
VKVPLADHGSGNNSPHPFDNDPCPQPEQGDYHDQDVRVWLDVPNVGVLAARRIGLDSQPEAYFSPVLRLTGVDSTRLVATEGAA